jgi:hypothetical protein
MRKRWAGHVMCMAETKNAYKILVRRLTRKRSLGTPKCRWEDNIKMDLKEIGCQGMDWIHLAQDTDHS